MRTQDKLKEAQAGNQGTDAFAGKIACTHTRILQQTQSQMGRLGQAFIAGSLETPRNPVHRSQGKFRLQVGQEHPQQNQC
jgi:hypothetical protein